MLSGRTSSTAKAETSGEKSSVAPPSITLPKGGGAIRGIGEKFATNPVTGTGSMTLPIFTSPGRSHFGPQLSLSYDSGAGNGPFGFGWYLALPAITRKTDKGLPQYNDAADSDVFILSGAEDLVPELEKDAVGDLVTNNGKPVVHDKPRTVANAEYRVRRYRPRIEGLFARIERWTNTADTTDVFWRSISKDNITTWYGATPDSRIADPADKSHIFTWLICQSYDDKGNVIIYDYKTEDSVQLFEDASGNQIVKAHERNRTDATRSAQRYLKRIRYGNCSPYFPVLKEDAPWPEPPDASPSWHFEVVFDYGEHVPAAPTPRDEGAWPVRSDPFSSYRAGFEVRTYRLCQRVLMFHHFPGEQDVGSDCLVRSTDFTYSYEQQPNDVRDPIYSFLCSITQTGYKREGATYRQRSLPPVEFEYSPATVQESVQEVDATSLENLPIGLDGATYQWADLHGEGIPGILTEQAGAWFFKRNSSPISERPVEFAPLECVGEKPNLALASGAQLLDLAGDGQPDLVVLDGPTPGLYEHDDAEGWQPFRPFTARLVRDMRDPNLKFVDLDGDGHADVLISEDGALVWHASLAEEGFGPASRVAQAIDEERGPRLVFADGTQSIYLADLSGDGLTDLVRIRNGEVCYWPNLGYGRFGALVTMDNAPWFDTPDQFDQKRIRLADIDGSGTTDIMYLHRDGVRLYFNQSGNSWGQPHSLPVFPGVDDLTSVVPIDLLGNGTVCLVWSSPLPGNAQRQMRYLDLMGEQKPHLLIKIVNNLGAEIRVAYAPSTKFYLQDKAAGNCWITRLPFPMHVVEKVETIDHISHNRFVNSYTYHHGYFDGEEREFRGFGMVEQKDTEEFAALTTSGAPGNQDAASYVPPVLTRTWFHTGIYLGGEQVSRQFEHEYFREPGLTIEAARSLLLPDTILPEGLSRHQEREAVRALKGAMLRQEIYALDGTGVDGDYPYGQPYSVIEQNFTLSDVQPRGANRHAVFFTHPRETITYHYERNGNDPRIQHTLTLAVDDYGNVLKQAAIGYGRRDSDSSLPAQQLIHITYSENTVTNAIIELADHYRTPLPAESQTYELRKSEQDRSENGLTQLFRFADMQAHIAQAADGHHDIAYEDFTFAQARQAVANQPREADQYFRRLIEQTRTRYRPDDCGTVQNTSLALLTLGSLEPLALPGESYQLAFTPGLLNLVFQRDGQALLPDPAAVLGGTAGDTGGYVELGGNWWIPSGRVFYHSGDVAACAELAEARRHFFQARRYRDPFGNDTFVDFDAHDLLIVETRDTLGNRVTVEANDYRVLQPRLVSDPNRNQTEVAFDTLGLLVGTAVMGKPLPAPVEGDTLAGFVADLTEAELDDFVREPRQSANTGESQATQIVHNLLNRTTTRIVYDLDRFRRLGEPPFATTIARETHVSDLPHDQQTSKLQLSFTYSDGFGREIQKKIQAERGPVPQRDAAGTIVVDAVGRPVMTAGDANPRWVGSGWTIFNNKGKPVRQYEPFFTDRHQFEFDVTIGVSPVLFYDPLERVVATLHPNHTYEKVVFDPWQQTSYDVNDTCAARNAQTGDPRTDPDIGGIVAAYFAAQSSDPVHPWQTWHAQRIGGALGQDERNAAERAAAHADTPTTTHFDALGRPFLTVARNRTACPDHPLDGRPDEEFCTRVEIDIEGNQRAVLDERRLPLNGLPLGEFEQRLVMRYDYDMLGNCVYQASMEAGARWMLNDVAGKPIRAWDSRGHTFTTTYDTLRRPVGRYVLGTNAASDPRTLHPPGMPGLLVDVIEYGESVPNAEAYNLRTRIYRHCDPAGEIVNAGTNPHTARLEAYDFKGNLLRSTRRLATHYTALPDWSGSPLLEAEFFEGGTRYDALNRPIQSVVPHGNLPRAKRTIIQPTFNEANLLEQVHVWPEHAAEPATLLDPASAPPSPVGIARIDYDTRGQRTMIDYKTRNGTVVRTTYVYDYETLRLAHLYTRRGIDSETAAGVGFTEDCVNPAPPPLTMAAPNNPPAGKACGLQNLHYTYDPAGNITHIRDDAQQAVYFRNRRVEASNDYTYDALYRLIQATGREHLGLHGNGCNPPTPPDAFNAFHTRLDHPGDGDAMGTYTERYIYDTVGNIMQMQHRGSDPAHPGWTRSYTYNESSLIEPGKHNNRLNSTLVGNGTAAARESYAYDAHGSMVRMPHLGGAAGPNMHWDYKDQLRQVDLGGGGVAYEIYDWAGQRVRKVWEKAPGLTEERLYLGSLEIFRRHGGAIGTDTATLERETLHVTDDTQRIALVETRTLDMSGTDQAPRQSIRYQHGNHLGSASLELDQQAQVISYEEYAPYGSTTYQAVRNETETPKRYRYTGKERDEESGLYYHGARYYAPWLGRWASTDPAGLADGLNLYRYTANNPLSFADRSGLAKSTADANRNLGKNNEYLNNVRRGYEGTASYPGAHDPRKSRATVLDRVLDEVAAKDTQVTLRHGTGVPLGTAGSSTIDQVGKEVVFEDKARHLGKKTFRQASQDAKRIAAQSLQRISNTGVPEVIDITVYSEGKKVTAERFKRMVERQLEKHGLTDLATVNLRTSEQVSKAVNVVKARSSAAMHAIEKIGRSEKAARLLPKLASVARAGRKIIPGVAAAMMVLGLASTAEAATTGTVAAIKGDTAKAVTNLGSAGADVVEMAPVVGSVVAAGRTGYAVGGLMNELFVDEARAMQHGDVARSFAKTLGASDSVADVAGGVAAAGSAIVQVLTWTPLRLL